MNTKPQPSHCPFCGEGANSDLRDNQWTVACCACPAGQVTGFDTEREAVEAWNRRVDPNPDVARLQARIKALETAASVIAQNVRRHDEEYDPSAWADVLRSCREIERLFREYK